MSAEAFCYLAATKKPRNLAAMLDLLAEPEQSRVRTLLKEAGPRTEPELRREWAAARAAELRTVAPAAARRAGVPPPAIPPRILDWLVYGFQDRQG